MLSLLATAYVGSSSQHHYHQEVSILFNLIPNPNENVFAFDSFVAMKAVLSTREEQIQYFSDCGILFDEKNGLDVVAEIHWAGRQLTEFDWTALSNLKSLRILNLERNALSGSMGWSLLPNSLQELYLGLNSLSGRVDLWKLPKSLEIADLSFNWLSGPIDINALALFPNLKLLDLRINRGIERPANLPMHVFVTETFVVTDDANQELL